jgi:hypothetical protein
MTNKLVGNRHSSANFSRRSKRAAGTAAFRTGNPDGAMAAIAQGCLKPQYGNVGSHHALRVLTEIASQLKRKIPSLGPLDRTGGAGRACRSRRDGSPPLALHPRVDLLKRAEAALRPTDADFAWKSLSKITQRREWHVDEAADQNTAARLQKRPADAHHRIQRLVSAPNGASL